MLSYLFKLIQKVLTCFRYLRPAPRSLIRTIWITCARLLKDAQHGDHRTDDMSIMASDTGNMTCSFSALSSHCQYVFMCVCETVTGCPENTMTLQTDEDVSPVQQVRHIWDCIGYLQTNLFLFVLSFTGPGGRQGQIGDHFRAAGPLPKCPEWLEGSKWSSSGELVFFLRYLTSCRFFKVNHDLYLSEKISPGCDLTTEEVTRSGPVTSPVLVFVWFK